MKTCKWCKNSKPTWNPYTFICKIKNNYVNTFDASNCKNHESSGTDTLNIITINVDDLKTVDVELNGKFSISAQNRVIFVNEFIDLIDKYRND